MSSIAWPTDRSALRSSGPSVLRPKTVPSVCPPHESGASPVIEDETIFAAAVIPAPIPIAASGPNGVRRVRVRGIRTAGVGGIGGYSDSTVRVVVVVIVVVLLRVVLVYFVVVDVVEVVTVVTVVFPLGCSSFSMVWVIAA